VFQVQELWVPVHQGDGERRWERETGESNPPLRAGSFHERYSKGARGVSVHGAALGQEFCGQGV